MPTTTVGRLAILLTAILIVSANLASAATTTLAAPANPGDTNIKVTSVTGFTAPVVLLIDVGASTETVTATTIGSATRATTLAGASANGTTNVKVASVTGLVVGDTVTIDSGPNLETRTITAVGTAGAVGTGITLSAPLGIAHASGVAFNQPGTGITFTPPLTLSHATGTAVATCPPPPTPTINAATNGTGTQNQACPEQPLTLTATSAGATSFQWYKDGNLLAGETNSTYIATAAGTYTATATNVCTSAQSAGYVVQDPTPVTPVITPLTATTFCQGGSVTLQSDNATGIQWYMNGVAIPGETNQTYIATASGTYTAQLNSLGCHSQFGNNVVVTVNPTPPTPTITPGGPTTFCTGGSVTLTSSSASGNQWFLNGNPIGGATSNTYIVSTSGNYTVAVTSSGCSSAPSAATTVTVNPIPPTPTITPGGPTTFCTGGSVTLTSSSASGNQWFLNGNPIGGATSNTYIASTSGNYTVAVTSSGCSSAPSAATTVTVNPNPNATITSPSTTTAGAPGTASVANAGVGATYNWSITNGSITSGAGTPAIGFTAGAVGTMTLQVTVTTSAGCSDTKSLNVTVTGPTVTTVTPATGPTNGGTIVTIQGTGFQSGATVTFGGVAATNVIVNSATQITATSPGHVSGAVDVVVTNPDTTTATLPAAFVYAAASAIPLLDWRVLVLLAIALSLLGARMGS